MPAARPCKDRFSTIVALGSALACVGTVHQLFNRRLLRRPPADPAPHSDGVSVLVPARDEAHRIGPTVAALAAQQGPTRMEILVLDDNSTDGTAQVVTAAARSDPRVRVLAGTPPPPGTLGKPHACAQLAAAARFSTLVYVDADVVLHPRAIAAAVDLLRGTPLDLVSPWPRQLTAGVLGRLIQPLLAWSWLTTVPLRVAERSPRPSLAFANGQFLVLDADALARAGGWQAVRGEVLDDIALARAMRRAGARTAVADGAELATCRMYATGRELAVGYRKSLWAAFGSPLGAVAVGAALGVVYVVPAAAMLTGSGVGALGYGAAVLGRVSVARWCGDRGPAAVLDGLAHPLSVLALLGLLAWSWVGRLAGTLYWKGRPL